MMSALSIKGYNKIEKSLHTGVICVLLHFLASDFWGAQQSIAAIFVALWDIY